MKNFSRNIIRLGIAGVMLLSLFGCGGNSSNEPAAEILPTQLDPVTVTRSGAVGILLTDKPADPSLFTSINATIARIDLIGADSEEKVTVYSGVPKTVDLLRLKNESMPFSFREDVPAGRYCKIRLTLDDLQLVLADETPDNPSDNETHYPSLPGNGKLDLSVRDCFTVEAGKVVTLQIDLDAGKSIHIVQNGNGYNFRPVIFVDVLDQGFEGKLVRLEGEISEVDAANHTLLLCGALPIHNSEQTRCARIYLGDDSAFFDNQQYAGEPRAVSELLTDERIGDAVTVVGWSRPLALPEESTERAVRSANEECRRLQRDLDDHDDDSDDCDEHSDDDLLDDDERSAQGQRPLMALNALVVELGDFLQLEGRVAADADAQGFDMDVTSGAVVVKDTLAIAFQDGGAGVNGTRIVSRTGRLLDYTQLTEQRTVSVDGVLKLAGGSEDQLNAALVIVDTGLEGREQLTGTVLSVGIDSFILSPAESACGFNGDLFVSVSGETEYLTVTVSEDNSEIAAGGEIKAGQEVGLSGVCENGMYSADHVVIVDDRRS